MRPSLNLEIIHERLDTISTLLHPENADTLNILVKELKSVSNMRVTMINLRKGISCGLNKYGGVSKNVWAGIRQVRAFLVCNIELQLPDIIFSSLRIMP